MSKRKINSDSFRSLLQVSPARAIDLLYKNYFHALVNISLVYTKNKMLSEDIVAWAFVFLYENRKRFNAMRIKSIQHYLVRVIRNKSIDGFRQQIRAKRLIENFIRLKNLSEQSVEAKLIDSERLQELRQFISTFPRREQQCLTMMMDEDMSPEQIATRLNISRKSVERGITSGRKRLSAYRSRKK